MTNFLRGEESPKPIGKPGSHSPAAQHVEQLVEPFLLQAQFTLELPCFNWRQVFELGNDQEVAFAVQCHVQLLHRLGQAVMNTADQCLGALFEQVGELIGIDPCHAGCGFAGGEDHRLVDERCDVGFRTDVSVPGLGEQVELDLGRDRLQEWHLGQEAEGLPGVVVELPGQNQAFERFVETGAERRVGQVGARQGITADSQHGQCMLTHAR